MSFLQFTKDDIMHAAIELAVMALLGLVVLLFVVRPLVRRILTPEEPRALSGGPRPARRALPRKRGRTEARPSRDTPMPKPVPSQTSKMIDIAQVQGQVHAQSVQKVGELADKQPERNRRHHPSMAARRAGLIADAMAAAAHKTLPNAVTRSPISWRRSPAGRPQSTPTLASSPARSAPPC
jgi:hypothetical protein